MPTNQAALSKYSTRRCATLQAQKSLSKIKEPLSSSSVSLGSTFSGVSQFPPDRRFPENISNFGKRSASTQMPFPSRILKKLCGCGCLESVLALNPHTCNSPWHDENTTRELFAAWCKAGKKEKSNYETCS